MKNYTQFVLLPEQEKLSNETGPSLFKKAQTCVFLNKSDSGEAYELL